MGLLADITIPAAELYTRRFCISLTKHGVPTAPVRYRPLLEFAEIEWSLPQKGTMHVLAEPITAITGAHFNLLQANAHGFGQLFDWFPPRSDPSGDECRIMIRAGINLKFVPHKNGVYNRRVSKYN